MALAGLALAGTASALQSGLGIYQAIRGNQMMKKYDKDYVVPSEIQANVRQAEDMARVGLPQEQYNKAQQNILRNQGAGVRMLNQGGRGIAGIVGAVQATQDAQVNLDVQDANARRQNMLQAIQQRGVLASYKDKAFEYNIARRFNMGQALLGAGIQNIAGGLGSAAKTGMYQSVYGEGRQTPAPKNSGVDASGAVLGDINRAIGIAKMIG